VQGAFPWQWLVDPAGAQGVARFDRQYWRANVDPSERYVLSVAGSSAARVTSAGSGLANLYLAGDWLRTGLDSGCVEAAVMGGMQASRALTGYPESIAGDSDF
jgi:predicted NAD/FAD-dependent oxidoreductase